MTDTTPTVPEWAKERAKQLAAAEPDGVLWSEVSHNAFARYIAATEEPPVDPLEAEARKLIADNHLFRSDNQRQAILNGHAGTVQVGIALAALRRGIELAREQQP